MTLFLIVRLTTLLTVTAGNRLAERIYNTVSTDSIHSCFRRLNGTDTIGCTSSIRGDVGVLVYLESPSDLVKLTDKTFSPYIVLINPSLLSGSLVHQLSDTGLVSGLILPSVEDPQGRWYNMTPAGGYSDDSKCPNNAENCRAESGGWNTAGSGLLWSKFSFPIFYLPESQTTEELYQCYQEHNLPPLAWPLCSVEMKANMHAATDSKTCVRRSHLNNNLEPVHFCDPLSDINIQYSLAEKVNSNKQVVLVTARLDTVTMFDQTEVGFDSPVTGLVTLLSTARIVSQAVKAASLTGQVDNVLFLLLNGESWDNTGTSRLIYDIEQGDFVTNLRLADIHTVVELGQLSNINTNTVFLHTVNNPASVKSALQRYASGLVTVETASASSVPPSSIAKLVSARPDLPAVMLTNFDAEFSNLYYHSLYDTAGRHGYNVSLGSGQPVVQHLSNISLVLARTLLSLTTEADLASVSADPDLVSSLLECYSVTANCSMFKAASNSDTEFPWSGPRVSSPWPQYVSVVTSPHTRLSKQLLQLLTGTVVNLKEVEEGEKKKQESWWKAASDECTALNSPERPLVSHVYLVGGPECYQNNTVVCGHCYATTVTQSDATSPVFIKEVRQHYDWASGQFPTWTESVWKGFSARSFLQGSPGHDRLVFGVGISVFLLSLLLGWWSRVKASILFSPCGEEIQLASSLTT